MIENILISGGSGGAPAIVNSPAAGNPQGSAAAADGSGGSLFQQLISRMLAGNGMTAEDTGEDAGGAVQDKAGGAGGDLLSGLLMGGNLTGSGIENAGLLTAETAAAAQTGEAPKADGTNAVTEALLALAGGSVPVQASGNLANAGEMAGQPQAALISAISQAETALTGGALKAGDSGKAVQESGKPVFTAPNADLQQGETPEGNASPLTAGKIPADSGEPANSGAMNLTGIQKDGLASGKTEDQKTLSGQKFNLSAAGTGSQAAASGSKTLEQRPADMTMPGQDQKAGMTGVDKAEAQNSSGDAASVSTVAAAHNPMAQTTGTADPYSQISNEILTRAEAPGGFTAQLEQKGPMEFKMQLEPADLGQIDIKLKLSEGKLIIDILAANSKTHALLTSQVDKLISSMGLQNVQVESVQVSQQMNSQSQNGGQSQSYAMNSAMDFSQRGHQEQLRQEFGNSMNSAAASGLSGNDALETGAAGRIESLRYHSHRMDYAV